VVPILGTSVDNEAVARAAKLVGPDAAVEAVYVLKVPGELPLNPGGMEEEERMARRVLEVARLQAKVAGCRVRCRLVRTRNPGRAIVDEARERRSDLIYISTEHAPSEERLLGPTTRYVLANRPCRVVAEHDPTAFDVPTNGKRALPSAALERRNTAGAGLGVPAPASAHSIRR
jgi:nucleotide-binding universal stress UspA family protein